MNDSTQKRIGIILIFSFIGWVICGAIMGIGMSIMSMKNTLIAHAVLAPVVFFFISLFYFKRFGYTTPLQTAMLFISFIVFMDFFVVSLLIEGNFDMFGSVLGFYVPILGIFIVTMLTGFYSLK